jgi:Ran GTPase-activating protein (RanGAP) involved in mRNA processing and transport
MSRDSLVDAAVIPPALLRTISTSADPTLTSIDFSNKALKDESLFALLTALESNNTVTSINLSNCRLTDGSCTPIGELLSKNATLQQLYLDNNQIGVEGVAALSTALITNEVLKTLTLNGNPLGDRGLIYLAKACGHNSSLSTLEMEQCGITQVGRVEQLQSLLLKRRIDSNFESLLERLQDDDYRVTGIDLSGRPLGDGGIHRLSEALTDNTQVRQLWLRDCSVSNAGAKALASCLEQNMSIVDLFLGGNDIGDEGLGYICEALRRSNATLVSLEMDDNRISQRGVRDFISALGKNTTVLVATFENNMKDAKCLDELDHLLEERRKGMNLVSFVVDPEDPEEDDDNKSGLVNMSVCSSYMPSTYRRAG